MKASTSSLFVVSVLFAALALGCSGQREAPPPAPTEGPSSVSAQAVWTGALDEAAFAALHELSEAEAPPRLGARFSLAASGSRAALDGYLSLPPGTEPPLAAVVLIHEWWGLNGHIEHWADRIAAQGYAVLAVDLYGGTVATTREEAMAAMGAVDAEGARAQLKSAIWYAKNHPRIQAEKIATMGWCFGGKWSLEAAIAHPELQGAVIYYGQLVDDPARLANIGAEVLGVFGTRDPSIPNEVVDQFEANLKDAGVEHRILRYDAEHAFANPSSARYDQANAEAAWGETQNFLARVLKGE